MAFIAGIATDDDVRKITDAITLDCGQEASYERIAEIIGVNADASRYRTITDRWRREVFKQSGMAIVAVRGKGFRALLPTEQISHGFSGFKRGVRKIARSTKIVGSTRSDGLSSSDLARRDHLVITMGQALASLKGSERTMIEPPKPAAIMPQSPQL